MSLSQLSAKIGFAYSQRRPIGDDFQYTFHGFSARAIRQILLKVDAQNLTGATHLYGRAGVHKIDERIYYEKELRAGNELSTQVLDEPIN